MERAPEASFPMPDEETRARRLERMQARSNGISRRRFLSLGGILGSVVGGAVAVFEVELLKNQPFHLRPPGALPEEKFLATCLRCGQCAQACPYNAIRLEGGGGGLAIGTPVIQARRIPCYLCEDLPCIRACPSGALDPSVDDRRKVRMGLAVIVNRETCLALQGMRCEVCYRACPLRGDAIRLEFRPNTGTGRHAIFEPVVDLDACAGCGLCEHACVLETPAIRVLSREAVLGIRQREEKVAGWRRRAL